jgi:hypothetical protein
MSSPENDGDAAAEEAAAEAAAAADDATPLTNLTLPAAERALGRAGACAPLRLQSFLFGGPMRVFQTERVLRLLAAAARHDSLRALSLHFSVVLDDDEVLHAVRDAAAALALPTLFLGGYTHEFAGDALRSHLPRMLLPRGVGAPPCALSSLTIEHSGWPGLEAEGLTAPALLDAGCARALRDNGSLTTAA